VAGQRESNGPDGLDPAIGLCATCLHCRVVKSDRSVFYMCRRSLTEPEYRKYPPLPVLRCPGYELAAPSVVEGDGKLKP
jgi:hypothetical protein